MPKNVSRRLKISLIVVLVLALIRFVFVPLSEWQDRTIERIQLLQTSVGQKRSLIGQEKAIGSLFEQATTNFGEVSQLFVKNFSDPQSLQLFLQKEMERLSTTNGVKINRTNWLPASAGEIVQAPIKLTCEATPENLMKFLAAIETAKYFFSVDILKITSSESSATLSVEVDVSAYGYKGES